jgi:hypothetical protein
MTLKGSSYDVGRVLGVNRRAVFNPDVAREASSGFALPFDRRSRG